MINAIVFDIGNVLLPFDYERAGRTLIERFGPAREPDREFIVNAKAELESGRIDRHEFLRRVRPEFGHEGDPADFLKIWEEIFDRNPPMEKLVEELARDYPLYLLSNISDIHREHIHRTYAVFRHFKDGVYSYEAGCLKPDPRIFEIARSQFRLDPRKTLYIDDMLENVRAAAAGGFVTVHYDHTRHARCEAEIRRLLTSDSPTS